MRGLAIVSVVAEGCQRGGGGGQWRPTRWRLIGSVADRLGPWWVGGVGRRGLAC